MKILICGGRNFSNLALFESAMKGYVGKATTVIHGAATGADTMAGVWARENGVEEIACPADWAAYGRAAGPIRNGKMIRLKPDLVIAFPGGRGTQNMVTQARKANLSVIQIKR